MTPLVGSPARALEHGSPVEATRRETLVALPATDHASVGRVAAARGRSRAAAEEMVPNPWLGAVDGPAGVAGRSSVTTWLFQILDHETEGIIGRPARPARFSSVPGGSADLARASSSASSPRGGRP